MNKLRLISKIAIFSSNAFQTKKFVPKIYLGDPINICNILSDQFCQEIVIVFPLEPPSKDYLKKILSVTRAPISVGGYGNNLNEIQKVIKSGAEKIILSDSYWSNPKKVANISKSIGAQALSLSIDYIIKNNERYIVCGKDRKKLVGKLNDLIPKMDLNNIGEIILNCVTKDGSFTGLDNIKNPFLDYTEIPILLSGGFAGEDFNENMLSFSGIISSSFINLGNFFKTPLVHYPEKFRVK